MFAMVHGEFVRHLRAVFQIYLASWLRYMHFRSLAHGFASQVVRSGRWSVNKGLLEAENDSVLHFHAIHLDFNFTSPTRTYYTHERGGDMATVRSETRVCSLLRTLSSWWTALPISMAQEILQEMSETSPSSPCIYPWKGSYWSVSH